jgi:hypothetical protein
MVENDTQPVEEVFKGAAAGLRAARGREMEDDVGVDVEKRDELLTLVFTCS